MAGKKLARNVTVGSETFEAGSTPPKEVADQINNPKAWEDEESGDNVGRPDLAGNPPTSKK